MNTNVTVRPLREEDTGTIAGVLARAFMDDPVGIWLFPDAARRAEALGAFFALFIRDIALRDDAALAAGDLAGAALWKPPGAWKVPPLALVRMLPALTKLLGRRLAVALRGLAEMEKVHPREEHAYLPFVGVEPGRHNQGIGSSLLAPVLQTCDRRGIGAYLEATSEANVRLYRRHGFEVIRELRLPGGLTLWPMWRDPR